MHECVGSNYLVYLERAKAVNIKHWFEFFGCAILNKLIKLNLKKRKIDKTVYYSTIMMQSMTTESLQISLSNIFYF